MTHPTNRHLLDYAVGSLPSGMGLLVASHLTFCPACRSKLARMETLGGAFLAETPPLQVPAPSAAAALARLDAPEAVAGPDALADATVLPMPIRRALGEHRPRWRRLLPGLWDVRLAGDAGEDVRLLKGRPGTSILTHTHEADEATLVLAGYLRDGPRTFGRGEVSLCGPDHNHKPEVVGEEDCFCLIVLSGRLRFTGRMARILNFLPQ